MYGLLLLLGTERRECPSLTPGLIYNFDISNFLIRLLKNILYSEFRDDCTGSQKYSGVVDHYSLFLSVLRTGTGVEHPQKKTILSLQTSHRLNIRNRKGET